MPGLLHSLVHGLNSTPMYASELIAAVFFGHVTVPSAAKLILLCLTEGAGTGLPYKHVTSFPSATTKRKLALTLQSTGSEWSGEGAAAILLNHVVARTPAEWKKRYTTCP